MWVLKKYFYKNVQNYPIGCSLSLVQEHFQMWRLPQEPGLGFGLQGSTPSTALLPPLFMLFPWTWSGVPWLSASGAHRIQSGSPTNPYPPSEYGGSGPDWKGEASRWDAESSLKVMGRVCVWGVEGGVALACGMAHNELLPSFCSSASQWEESLEGQITRAHRHKLKAKWRTGRTKTSWPGRVQMASFTNIWMSDELLLVFALLPTPAMKKLMTVKFKKWKAISTPLRAHVPLGLTVGWAQKPPINMILNILGDQYSTVVNLVLFDACLARTVMISCPTGPCAVVTAVGMRM